MKSLKDFIVFIRVGLLREHSFHGQADALLWRVFLEQRDATLPVAPCVMCTMNTSLNSLDDTFFDTPANDITFILKIHKSPAESL